MARVVRGSTRAGQRGWDGATLTPGNPEGQVAMDFGVGRAKACAGAVIRERLAEVALDDEVVRAVCRRAGRVVIPSVVIPRSGHMYAQS